MFTTLMLDLAGILRYLNLSGSVTYIEASNTIRVDIPTEVCPIYLSRHAFHTIDSTMYALQREKFLFDTFKGKTGVIWA